MTSKNYSLPSSESMLKVNWEGNYKNIEVFVDEVKIGETIKNPKILKEGWQLNQSDGHTIGLQYFQSQLLSSNSALEVKWDGNTLVDSLTQDNVKAKDASGCAGLVVIPSLIMGIIFLGSSPAAGIGTLAFAVVYLILWLFIRKGSSAALILFTVLYGLDSLFYLFTLLNGSSTTAGYIGGIALRVFALVIFINGVQAMNRLKNKASGQVANLT